MNRPLKIIVAVVTMAICVSCSTSDHRAQTRPSGQVIIHQNLSFTAKTGRVVGARVFFREGGCSVCPLIIFSHGANATYDRYNALLHAWARAGYVVAAPLHVDSEEHPRRADFGQEMHIPTRIEDYNLVRSALGVGPLKHAEDVSLSGTYIAAGHSFGALIAQGAGGAALGGPPVDAVNLPSAIIAVSPPGPIPGAVDTEAWGAISVPMLVVTGTEDVLPFIAPKWQDHLASHEAAPEAFSIALVFDGADHYFNGAFGRIHKAYTDSDQIRTLNTAVLAFMDQARSGVAIADMTFPELTSDVQLLRR